jgi:hypothetical protein
MTTIAKLASYAIEFFWGEAVYELEDQLRKLRKWRLITMSIPLAGLAMVTWTAFVWPQTREIEQYREGMAYKRLEDLEDVVVDIRIELAVVRRQNELVGWLIGAMALAFASQSIGYFYQLKLRKTLRGIEKRDSDRNKTEDELERIKTMLEQR